MEFTDKTLICKECGKEFVFSAKEQEFYKRKGLEHEPKRCKDCRWKKKTTKIRLHIVIFFSFYIN